jgi:hypothetical protein
MDDGDENRDAGGGPSDGEPSDEPSGGRAALDLERPRGEAATSRIRAPWLLGAAVVAVIALVVGVQALTAGDDDSTSLATDTLVGDLTRGWERTAIDSEFADRLVRVASNGRELLGITRTGQICTDDDGCEAGPTGFDAWISTSGSDWTRVGTIEDGLEPVDETEGPHVVTWNGERWVLAGRIDDESVTWSSPDGRDWDRSVMTAVEEHVLLMDVTHTDAGAVAVGAKYGQTYLQAEDPSDPEDDHPGPPTAWVTTDLDGLRWDEASANVVTLPTSDPVNRAFVWGVESIGSTIVAYGTGLPDSSDDWYNDSLPEMWISLDSGGTWAQTVLDERHGTVTDAAINDDRLLLSGHVDGRPAMWTVDRDGTPTRVPCTVLRDPPASTSGFDCGDHADEDGAGGWLDIASGPSGIVAVDRTGASTHLLVSSDGEEWTDVGRPDLIPEQAEITHLVGHGAGFVALGFEHVDGLDREDPVAWTWQPSASHPPTTPGDTTVTSQATETTVPADTTTTSVSVAPTTLPADEFVPILPEPSCVGSFEESLAERAADADGDMATEHPNALATVRMLHDAGLGRSWDEASVCVSGYGVGVEEGVESFSVDVVDHTLSADLEAQALALVPTGALTVERIVWEGIPDLASWELVPETTVHPTTRSIEVLVSERGCASGRSPEGRIAPPEVTYGDDTVTIEITVYGTPGFNTCPSAPPARYTVELAEPLGDRTLEGMSPPW